MRDGFVKVSARTPKVRVADVSYNVDQCIEEISDACSLGAKIVVLPELCITGYTCEDLFWQDALLDAAQKGLYEIAEKTEKLDALIFVGVPWRVNGKLYNCAAAINAGEVLALIPKTHVPNYNEFYELRHFTPATPTAAEAPKGPTFGAPTQGSMPKGEESAVTAFTNAWGFGPKKG